MGPLSPRDITDLLGERDASRADTIQGYRGIPTSELARALVADGTTVEVVTCSQGLEEPVTLSGPRLRVLVAPQRSRARARAADLFRSERAAMLRLLRQTSGEVLHAHWTYEFAWAAIADGRPALVTAHDAPLTILREMRDGYRAVRAAMAYLVRTQIRELTAVSPYLAERWRKQMLYRRPIRVIPNIARTLEASRPATRGSRPAKLVVDVASAAPLKNVESLVEAIRRLRGEGREIELGLIGPGLGPDDELATRVRADGMGAGVHFWGPLDAADLAQRLSAADIFAHPSREECCPVAVIEAMRAGVPLVVSPRSGGTPWVVDDGAAGRIAADATAEGFAQGIGELLDRPELARVLAERAKARAEALFAPAPVAAAYQDEYERIRAGAGLRRMGVAR